MARSTSLVLTVPLVLLFTACGETPEPAAPQVDAAAAEPAFAMAGGQIVMLDACDPETFNAFFEFEVCTPTHARSGISFSTFAAMLERHQRVDAWRFAPDRIRSDRTVTLPVLNNGGIPHSFTEVEEFGGGFIPLLNELSGNTTLAPECVHPQNPEAPNPDADLIAPGDRGEVTIEEGEEKKYMCCIHPWMRAVTG